jgi:tetratricopeptide (TPR) repeat protein
MGNLVATAFKTVSYVQPADAFKIRSLLDSGLAAHRQGELAAAADYYRQALAGAPENGDALNLLGTALLQLGHAQEAAGYLERAARTQRNNPRVLANLAQAYIAAGDLGKAHDAFRKAARIDPQQLQFQVGVANTLALQNRLSEAESLLRRLTTRFPESALVWFNLGNVLRDAKRRDEAIDLYRKAVALDPQLIDARNNLGSTLHAKLRFAEAEAQYRECIRLAPDYLLAHFNLTSVLIDVGRFAEAETAARELIARAPHAPEGHSILGSALGQQGRLLEAHACYEKTVELGPQNLKAVESLAMSLMETGHFGKGLRSFSRVLRSTPEPSTARQLLASALLAYGALQDGWAEYVTRPDATVFRRDHPEVPVTCGPFDTLSNKSVCVLSEQGLGDELFFLRYAPLLAERGANITYRASNKLVRLLSRVPSISCVIDGEDPLPPADAYILAGDLPHALGQQPASVLSELPAAHKNSIPDFSRLTAVFWPPVPPSLTLQPVPEKTEAMRARLCASGPPPYIGLTWRAGTVPEEQRSGNWVLFKAVETSGLAHAIGDSAGTLLALQRAPAGGEIEKLSALTGRPIHDFTAVNEDLDDMLALLALIDDYVGVSNTNMHLRAAIGRTARVLVPAPAEWRCMRSGRESPWFPGFTLYRQSLQGDWTAAFEALRRDLLANYGAR